ncbi:hypothetical protein EJP617_D010 (plasmid) [Erwinia sp. Ejp617]|nr:hypothetical protein EJP617_D010 [Erwinia sp. Ejp617]
MSAASCCWTPTPPPPAATRAACISTLSSMLPAARTPWRWPGTAAPSATASLTPAPTVSPTACWPTACSPTTWWRCAPTVRRS